MPDHKVHSSRVMMVLQFPDRGIREKKELPDRDDAELEITVDKLLCQKLGNYYGTAHAWHVDYCAVLCINDSQLVSDDSVFSGYFYLDKMEQQCA